MSSTEIIDNNATRMRERLTLQQASEEYGIPVPTLRTYRALNKGPASFRLGGKVYYMRQELDRWCAEEMASTRRGGI